MNVGIGQEQQSTKRTTGQSSNATSFSNFQRLITWSSVGRQYCGRGAAIIWWKLPLEFAPDVSADGPDELDGPDVFDRPDGPATGDAGSSSIT